MSVLTGFTLSYAAVSTVDDISEPQVCSSCSFTKLNASTAKGCTVELQNDEFTFVFSMSRQRSEFEELTLLECFQQECSMFLYNIMKYGMMGWWGIRFGDSKIYNCNGLNTTQSVFNGMITVTVMITSLHYSIMPTHSSCNESTCGWRSCLCDSGCDI